MANEIIRDGVPASRVLVEAVGDSQPVFYESMPQGEDGNRHVRPDHGHVGTGRSAAAAASRAG